MKVISDLVIEATIAFVNNSGRFFASVYFLQDP